MKLIVKSPPSREQIEQFVMQICSRKTLVELAMQKGLKDVQHMTKQQLCEVVLG